MLLAVSSRTGPPKANCGNFTNQGAGAPSGMLAFDSREEHVMKSWSILFAVSLFGAAVSTQAYAICLGADSTNGCPQPFVGADAGPQPSGTSTTTSGFDSRTQTQWTQTTTPFGSFKFSAGAGQYNPWTNPQAPYGNGFGSGFDNARPYVGSLGPAGNCVFNDNCR